MNENIDLKFTCDFCSKIFASKSLLTHHQTYTKYCLEIQNKKIEKIICEFCEKELIKTSLKKHLDKCKIKIIKENENKIIKELNNEINSLKQTYIMKDMECIMIKKEYEQIKKELEQNKKEKNEEIEKLKIQVEEFKKQAYIFEGKNEVYKTDQQCLHKIAQQVKTNNNTTYNNLVIYDENVFTQKIKNGINQFLTPEIVCEGQVGLSKILGPCIEETKMIGCSDKSRSIFITKDKDGNLIKDIKGVKIASVIEPIASEKVDEIIQDDFEKRTCAQQIKSLQKNIRYRIERIQELEDFIDGLNSSSKEWNYNKNKIEEMIEENKRDSKLIENMLDVENMFVEYNDDILLFDEKLISGASQIKTMKTDPSKFTTKLTGFL